MADEHRVVASTRLIAAITLCSRLLGLARECTFSYFFGTGALLSAFRIAFMVPNLARRLFGEGALSAAFIPVFTRALRSSDPEHPRRLAGGVLTLLVLILLAIVAVIECGLLIASAVSPGLTLRLTAIMLPFMALICLVAFLGGILNTLGRFAAPAAAPMILNIFVILAIIGGSRLAGFSNISLLYATCVAVLLAGVAQVGLQLAAMRRRGFRPILNRDWNQPGVREIVRFMGPMIIGLSSVQINTMLDLLIAKFFVADGRGPAVLGFAHFLYQLPLGVFGIAVATAIFPVLASNATSDDKRSLSRTVQHGVALSFLIALPASVGLILVADPLVAALLQYGEFDAVDTARVARTLVWYSVGLCAYSCQHIIVRAFYAMKDSRTPARLAMLVVAFNLALNLILVQAMGEAGVALATALSATLQVLCLAAILRRRLPFAGTRDLLTTAVKTTLATAIMAPAVWLIVATKSPLPTGDWPATARLALAVPIGLAVFTTAGRLLQIPELTQLLRLPSERGQTERPS